ncbi:MAG: hypothetical protein HY361_02985 [Candidatus Aenigmarchaeota archaeon]|nr:hypothetical protein [Candidatus Aenigmarchaeota archaeon]
MSKIGNYDYPTLAVEEALKIARDFKERLSGKGSLEALANMIGHKDARSGTFLVKIADLRKYGLFEGRGEVWLSTLAEALLYPKDDAEYRQKITEMVFNIELWKKLFERLNGKLPSNDFWIILQEVTKVDRATAQKEAERISKLYLDAITKAKLESITVVSTPRPAMLTEHPFYLNEPQLPTSSQLIELKAGEIHISLPKTRENIKAVISILENLEKTIDDKTHGKK